MEAEIKGIKERSISKRIGQQTIYKKVKENETQTHRLVLTIQLDTQTSIRTNIALNTLSLGTGS